MTPEEVMKKCQIGCNNLNDCNNLLAECYGTIGKLVQEKETLRDYIQTKVAVQMRQLIAEYKATTDFAIHLLVRYEKRDPKVSEELIKHNAVMRSQPYRMPE
jgi:hypothetical protein